MENMENNKSSKNDQEKVMGSIKKAWVLSYNFIARLSREDMSCANLIMFGDNPSTVKKKFLKELTEQNIVFDSYHINIDADTTIRYKDILIERKPEFDLYLYNDSYKSKFYIDRMKKIDSFMNDTSIEYFYIMKNGYYYRPGSCGYTESITRAGVYNKKKAIFEARGCEDISIIPIFDIEKHNKEIDNEISSLANNKI